MFLVKCACHIQGGGLRFETSKTSSCHLYSFNSELFNIWDERNQIKTLQVN